MDTSEQDVVPKVDPDQEEERPDLEPNTVTVGLMADPGLPLVQAEKLAKILPDLLSAQIDEPHEWVVVVEESSLPLDTDGTVALVATSPMLRQERHWDYLVYVTDLPKYQLNEPLMSTLNTAHGSAMIVLPTLGLAGFRRLRSIVVQAIIVLYNEAGGGDVLPQPLSPLRDIATVDDGTEGPESLDTVETVKGPLGRLAMLTGMVRSNRPLRLVPKLSSSMAAAIATGAFGIFYTNIWSMADYLSPWRLTGISCLSVTIMSLWLIGSHRLWERPRGARSRERHVVYNAATTGTVFIAVAAMYLGLFVVIYIGGLVVINIDYLGAQLGHQAMATDYLNLAWLSASMGTIAGAVGSSLTDPEIVRQATFSNREYERRQISVEREMDQKDDDVADEGPRSKN
ncbi:hypothetical protein [Arthrobacter rhombi]|uniref:Uncharacterized protein n=1 Tax=Arthrobacter rhombi TaxID=71253 RepID=A0A1R4GRF2_9MICC|nr:hypothetical protein [Arthrobacter rhombi]SJM70747.1 hypothetical protein FM101_12685 [Arthrobacter rhombi]